MECMGIRIEEVCPFCAADPDDLELFNWDNAYPGIYETVGDSGLDEWVVRCKSCGACGPPANTMQEAIKSWNQEG